MSDTVHLFPAGQLEHDHILQGMIYNTSIYWMEHVLGEPHSTGDMSQMTAMWFLRTDHGSCTIHDHWGYDEGQYAIRCANDRVAAIVVDYLNRHKIEARQMT